jgi:hypothetical protein
MPETRTYEVDLVKNDLLQMDTNPDRYDVQTFLANSRKIHHRCGGASEDNWQTVGECIHSCFGPYIQLEPGKYDFYWLVSYVFE